MNTTASRACVAQPWINPTRSALVFFGPVFFGLALSVPCRGQAIEPPAAPQWLAVELPPFSEDLDTGSGEPRLEEGLRPWLRNLLLKHIPHQHEDKRRWGGTKEIFDGLKISQRGLQIKTKRRKKEVNHGTWKMYRIELLDPHEQFQVRLENIRPVGNGRLGFDTVLVARLQVFGRLAQWERGVQLISLSAHSEAQVQLRLRSEIGLRVDLSERLPQVAMELEVTDADLELVEFRVRRISRVGGTLARELGHGLRHVLETKLQQNRQQLVEKINQQIQRTSGLGRASRPAHPCPNGASRPTVAELVARTYPGAPRAPGRWRPISPGTQKSADSISTFQPLARLLCSPLQSIPKESWSARWTLQSTSGIRH